jgi:hypothetical protein
MKKLVLLSLAILLVLTASLPAFAAELPKESEDFSVVYTNNCNGVTVPSDDGIAAGKLSDGTEFSAENLPEDTENLRVYPVQSDEKDVQKWIEDALPDEYDAAVTYAVVCTDADGKETSNKGAGITVDAPETNAAVTVYAIDGAGKATALTAVGKDGKITFTATGAQLYALCVATKNPSTADRNTAFFTVILAVSVITAFTLFGLEKSSPRNEKPRFS